MASAMSTTPRDDAKRAEARDESGAKSVEKQVASPNGARRVRDRDASKFDRPKGKTTSERHHHRHRSVSSRSRSKSRSRSSSRSRNRRKDSHRSSSRRHYSSSSRHHHSSSSRRSRSRERGLHRDRRHASRRHSKSRSDSRERDRSSKRSRRDSRDAAEARSSRRKYSDERKRSDRGDRRRQESEDLTNNSSHRKRSRDENEGEDSGKSLQRSSKEAKREEPTAQKENVVLAKTDEKTDEPVQEDDNVEQIKPDDTPHISASEQEENVTEKSGSTSPIDTSSSTSQPPRTTPAVKGPVDPLTIASSAKKLIEEAKASLLKEESKATVSTPQVNVSSIKQNILKALAEARSTIAVIKGDADTQGDQAQQQQPPEQNKDATTEQVVQSEESKPSSPKKETPSQNVPPKAPVAAVDEFDMFSMAELDDAAMPSSPGMSALTVNEASMQSNCDDPEGYYNTTVGEVLNGSYRVLGIVGKGVFSTVLRCARIIQSKDERDVVAVKLIRNNDVMRDAAQTEVRLLKELGEKDPRDKKHCVRLLDTFEHRNHVALVFEPMQMNVREAMKKFGGKGGISIQAVRVFSKHLLIALNHLESCSIVHADIKPDNILLDEKQTTIKLCDLGSAFKVDEGKQDPTPYLVSRFYRAPEIVLGLPYDKSVDMWSVGCCLYEMFTGKVMFPGSTNNEMLKLFMELKGKIPNKLIKKHRTAYIEQFQMEPHFTEDLKFCSRESDRVTGKPILRLMDTVKAKNDLGNQLMSAKSSTDDRKLVLELRNLLERMFTLDPTKRISVREALAHPFVKAS
uniref:non-specific serine/threonine protein kinase n=1 Tax=Globisporangium ultimum (strain ATCC 200006 / CBS 805.95 / DAOM BR144) TaxID=431595 RepID=K3WT40_GLOUD